MNSHLLTNHLLTNNVTFDEVHLYNEVSKEVVELLPLGRIQGAQLNADELNVIETPNKLEERKVGAIPLDVWNKIFSLLKWSNEFLCICKALRKHFLMHKKFILSFRDDNFMWSVADSNFLWIPYEEKLNIITSLKDLILQSNIMVKLFLYMDERLAEGLEEFTELWRHTFPEGPIMEEKIAVLQMRCFPLTYENCETIFGFINSCKSLNSLHFRPDSIIPQSIPFESLISNEFLVELNIRNVELTEKNYKVILNFIRGCKSLISLWLHNISCWFDGLWLHDIFLNDGFTVLEDLKGLKSLWITTINTPVAHIIINISKLMALQTLKIHNVHFPRVLISELPALQTILIYSVKVNLTLSKLPALRTVSIRRLEYHPDGLTLPEGVVLDDSAAIWDNWEGRWDG